VGNKDVMRTGMSFYTLKEFTILLKKKVGILCGSKINIKWES